MRNVKRPIPLSRWSKPRRKPTSDARRRGAVSVLAMILLIMFGSLAAAMAVASRGNIRTAATHVHVLRAMHAAETGLAVAGERLAVNIQRFKTSHAPIDSAFGEDLWDGNLGSYGFIEIDPAPPGVTEGALPSGLAEALSNHHAMDAHIDPALGVSSPALTSAPASADTASTYRTSNWLVTPAVLLGNNDGLENLAFQITYAPLLDGTRVRVIVTGFDLGYDSNNQPVSRTVMQDFSINKRIDHAIVSANRIMIGKNVLIEGDLATRFNDTATQNGNPVVIKSDFYGMDDVLDDKLDDLYEGINDYDVDQDNRLRPTHPQERLGLPSDENDYDNDGQPDNAFADITGDGFVDAFDVFIAHYDDDGDRRIEVLTEFTLPSGELVDPDLAILLDSAVPDRNRNGVRGFDDLDLDGVWDQADGETLNDFDAFTGTFPDFELGYMDGFIDANDQYAKLRGTLKLAADSAAWTAGQGDWRAQVLGPVVPSGGNPPTIFSIPDAELPGFDVATFNATQTGLRAAVDGLSFDEQVAANLGVSVADLATYVETSPPGAVGPGGELLPRFRRLDPDNDFDGLPDNYNDPAAYFERMPFNSPQFADWYYRPVYENMTFKDVEIPIGNNGLFINCTFAGVTWVRTWTENSHPFWTNYGRLEATSPGSPPTPFHDRRTYGDNPAVEPWDDLYDSIENDVIPTGTPQLLAINPLDKGDILDSEIGSFAPAEYDTLPEPLIITHRVNSDGEIEPESGSGTLTVARVTDTRQFSNNLRFHDSLFVGSIMSDAPTEYINVRNKIQFTGATRFEEVHPTAPNDPNLNPDSADLDEIAKSTMMLPHYSVDIGQFNSPPTQYVSLRGAVVAGVLDVRGNASIDGALLITFRPVLGQAPLIDALGNPVGNPASFNSTIGYFGPDDGDEESLDPTTLPEVGGVRIVGYDTDGDGLADADPFNPQPAGSTPVPFFGYGRIFLRFDPNVQMPDGIVLRLTIDPEPATYIEGKL